MLRAAARICIKDLAWCARRVRHADKPGAGRPVRSRAPRRADAQRRASCDPGRLPRGDRTRGQRAGAVPRARPALLCPGWSRRARQTDDAYLQRSSTTSCCPYSGYLTAIIRRVTYIRETEHCVTYGLADHNQQRRGRSRDKRRGRTASAALDRAGGHRGRAADGRARRHDREHRAAAGPGRPGHHRRRPAVGRHRVHADLRRSAAARRPDRRLLGPQAHVHRRHASASPRPPPWAVSPRTARRCSPPARCRAPSARCSPRPRWRC